MTNTTLITFMTAMRDHFINRETKGEDKAHWANVINAENCQKVADALSGHDARVTELLSANNVLVERERAAKRRAEEAEFKLQAMTIEVMDSLRRRVLKLDAHDPRVGFTIPTRDMKGVYPQNGEGRVADAIGTKEV